ncbi:YesL family protein [Gracilibacillus xinjiangensis]|uniref:YesL family protein n=1 Tax=Gracilibacillus xinjiangensis TaxID=1193282 RepID=A0ABV8WPZ5_9BACI
MHFQTSSGLFKLCEWIYRLAYLQLLAITGALAGGFMFGIFPSILAMFAINNRWLNGESDFSVSKQFWRMYKQYFIKANKLGGLILLTLIALWIDYALLQNFQGTIYYLILSSSTTVLIITISVLFYIFYLMIISEQTITQSIKTAIQIATLFPLQTFWMLLSILSFLFICWVIPGITIFYLCSGVTYLATFFSRYALTRLAKKNEDKHFLIERGVLNAKRTTS